MFELSIYFADNNARYSKNIVKSNENMLLHVYITHDLLNLFIRIYQFTMHLKPILLMYNEHISTINRKI